MPLYHKSSYRARAIWTAAPMVKNGMGDEEYIGKHLTFDKTSVTSKVTRGDSLGLP